MSDTTKFQEEKKQHWLSFESKDKKDLKAIQNQEFYTSPDPIINRIKTGLFDRKTFLKLMGASSAMLTVNCLPAPKEKIVPYVKKPENVTHGLSTYYASTCSACSASCGVLIKTKEGRPLKLEGNPSHPLNQGGLCATGQASILNLYDPDRAQKPVKFNAGKTEEISWEELDKAVTSALKANSGKTVILSAPVNSPSTKRIFGEFLTSVGGGSLVEYDATSVEESIAKAAELSYGKSVVPNYRFDKARVILSLDADFLGTWISPVEFSKQFASRKQLNEENPSFNQLIVVETMYSTTGSNADLRLAVKPGDTRKVALAIAKAISDLGGNSYGQLGSVDIDSISKETEISVEWIQKIAQALYNAKGESLVVAGGTTSATGEEVDLQIAVNLLNSMLGNDGITVDYVANRKENVNYSKDLDDLKKSLDAGEVGVLILNGVNLLYQMPEVAGWKSSLSKAKLVVSLSDRIDETTLGAAQYLAASNHSMESWGDSEPVSGLISINQPTILPLYSTRSVEDSLIAWAGGEIKGSKTFYDYLKSAYTKDLGNSGWIRLLQSGFFSTKGYKPGNTASRAFKGTISPILNGDNEMKLALYTSVALQDGSYANNPVLQELPDPVTKITWDNFVAVSPVKASVLGIQSNDVVKLKVGSKEILLPVQVQPGIHKNTIAVALGYGRTSVGKVGNGVGKNAFELATFANGKLIFSGATVSIEKTGKTYKLASTQDHHMMNPGNPLGTKWDERPLILSTKFEDYKKNPASGTEKADPEFPNIGTDKKKKLARGFNPEYEYKGYRWGMSVDLSLCTGCSACVIACQVENNIPVVGRDEVRVGREMHWIRIDRYYIGDPSKPETLEIGHQPVMCQHCENAPCETVCPVAATVHGTEGTNDMVYNRCVGTRYCSNNCPYKVRRYNWMEHWRDGKDMARSPRNLAFNPDVSVRVRGVMEKCTFCASRVAEKKIQAKNEGRALRDGEIKSACQETCPTDAIIFGDINNPNTQVSKNSKNKRAYKILDFLNVKPQVSYLTRVRNYV
jgi:molybdopterin-containing oxidoreductase family iron-sulfur binding subunit